MNCGFCGRDITLSTIVKIEVVIGAKVGSESNFCSVTCAFAAMLHDFRLHDIIDESWTPILTTLIDSINEKIKSVAEEFNGGDKNT